jgi:hypothetical protein
MIGPDPILFSDRGLIGMIVLCEQGVNKVKENTVIES